MAGSSAEQLLSRIAAGDGHGENSSYFDGWKAYDMNPFDLRHNRDGVIQMGLAENQVRTYSVYLPFRSVVLPTLAACCCRSKSNAHVNWRAAAVVGPDRAMERGPPGGVHLHGAGRVAVPEDSQLPGLPRPAGVQRGTY
jgi:hypothetical protein